MPAVPIATAARWRSLIIGLLAGGPMILAGPAPGGSPPAGYVQIGQPDQAEGKRTLELLRRQGISGNYYLEFQLRIMPRRGAERIIPGRLWGGHNEQGLISRVSLVSATERAVSESRLLIQNGPQPAGWSWTDATGRVEVLGVAALFAPVVPQTELTAFDLQMPFIYWPDFTYEGLSRLRGRPAHVFLLRPPAEFAAQHPALTAVRVHLDSQFNALVQTELLGANGRVLKSISVVDLKKIGDQWMVKSIDLLDETTRNKTRFSVTGAALGLEFAPALFEPAQLAEDVRPPAAGRIVRVEP